MTKQNPCVIDTLGLDEACVAEQIHKGNWERCEYCKCVFEWDRLPDENILKDHQSHPYGSTVAVETIVVGYCCVECGYKTHF